MKAKRVDKDIYRILADGIVVGLALRLANGMWRPADIDGNLLHGHELVKSPSDVATIFKGF